MKAKVSPVETSRYNTEAIASHSDLLVVEEPLEIRLIYGPVHDRKEKSIAVTMRTPGHDQELAAGFLFTEGIVQAPAQILKLAHCQQVKSPEEIGNVIRAELAPSVELDLKDLQRHFYTTSSCGVCGKASIEALSNQKCMAYAAVPTDLTESVIHGLPEQLRAVQTVFKHTGGIHATGLFDLKGELLLMREDVGRHNALDKVIGAMFLQGRMPLQGQIGFCSGRLGFELVQKALMAGLPVLAAVGAPTSLAVQTAQEFGLALLGFVRNGRFNAYLPLPSTITIKV